MRMQVCRMGLTELLIAGIERQPAGDVMIREPMNLLTRQSVARP